MPIVICCILCAFIFLFLGWFAGVIQLMQFMRRNADESVQFFPVSDEPLKVVDEEWFTRHRNNYKLYLEHPRMWVESFKNGKNDNAAVSSSNDAVRNNTAGNSNVAVGGTSSVSLPYRML
jgi:hypothetical protein